MISKKMKGEIMKKLLLIIFFLCIVISFSDNFLDLGNQEFENKNYGEAIKYYKKSKTDEGNFMTGVSMFKKSILKNQ